MFINTPVLEGLLTYSFPVHLEFITLILPGVHCLTDRNNDIHHNWQSNRAVAGINLIQEITSFPIYNTKIAN